MIRFGIFFIVLFVSIISFAQEDNNQIEPENEFEAGDFEFTYVNEVLEVANHNSILFISGGVLQNVSIDSMNNEFIYYKQHSIRSKTDISKVFSFSIEKNETILYKQDSVLGNELSVEQMKDFILGEQAAKKNHKIDGTICSSMLIGGASGVFGFWGLPVPLIYSIIINPAPIKKNKLESNECGRNKDCFDAGYKSGAKNKKLKASIVSGLTSFLVVTWLIL